MLNFILGQYMTQAFGAQIIDVTFETTMLANASSNLSLANAVDSAFVLGRVGTYGDIYLIDCLSQATTFTEVSLLPDLDSGRKIRIDAQPTPVRVPFPLPVLIGTDVNIAYSNGPNPNNLYLNFSAIAMSKTQSSAFQAWAEHFANGLLTGGAATQSFYNT
jgi:hypothetical protein